MICLGLRESLAERRLRRCATHSDSDEQFYEQGCALCGTALMWNIFIYPPHEPHRCERCAPLEHWQTGISRKRADELFRLYENDTQLST